MDCIPDAPCSGWDMPDGCCKTCSDDDPLLARMWESAVAMVYRKTCWRFPGCCDVEVQPCPPCGCGGRSCSRCGGGRLRIPVGEIGWCYPIKTDADGLPLVEVTAAGVPLAGWRLTRDKQFLESCDATGWPDQSMCDDPPAAGTWTVRATIGCDPPPDLLHATARFACELVKECRGEDSCLPDGVTSISRRGLTMNVGSDLAETINFETGGTGIAELDLLLADLGCTDHDVAAHFDPLDYAVGSRSDVWEFRHVWVPSVVGS